MSKNGRGEDRRDKKSDRAQSRSTKSGGSERRSSRGPDSGSPRGAPGGSSPRTARVEKAIRDAVATHLRSGFRGQLPGLISISRVSVSADLRSARVHITVMPLNPTASSLAGGELSADELKAQTELRERALSELRDNAYDLQSAVAAQTQLRFTPKLVFFYDEALDHAIRINEVLSQIRRTSSANHTDGDDE